MHLEMKEDEWPLKNKIYFYHLSSKKPVWEMDFNVVVLFY